jgi:hypothetical protein
MQSLHTKMAFKLPIKVNTKRTRSFNQSKIQMPQTLATEESENYYNRHKALTPGSTKNNRALSFIDVKYANQCSKNSLHQQIYDTPKSHHLAVRRISKSELKAVQFPDFVEKEPSRKAQDRLSNEIIRLEEKYQIQIRELTEEKEKLVQQVERLKTRRNTERQNSRTIVEMKKTGDKFQDTVEMFIIKTREVVEKLCNCIIGIYPATVISEINSMLQAFNANLECMVPFIGYEKVSRNQFLVCTEEELQKTGRFKSLRETQTSFGVKQSCNDLKEVIALADFNPSYYGELSFRLGDRIQLIKTDDPEWWLGKVGEKVGRIPVQLVMLD